MSRAPNAVTVRFRIESVLKTAFAKIATEESKLVGELLRERVEQKARREFESDARRKRSAGDD
jgi:hypothetical protein